jgi:hypothetical protein
VTDVLHDCKRGLTASAADGDGDGDDARGRRVVDHLGMAPGIGRGNTVRMGVRAGLVVVSLLAGMATACGESTAPTDGAVARESSALTPVEPDATTAEPTVPDPSSDVGSPAAPTGPATAEPTVPDPSSDVSVDDPVPVQIDAVADLAGADAGVRFAYTHWILVDLDADVRARLVENGDALRDSLAQGFADNRAITEHARFAVDTVRFVDGYTARVEFRILWQGNPSPYFPDPLVGSAVFVDGSWRVGSDTVCRLAIGSGASCSPDPAVVDPTPPEALQATTLPGDVEWLGFDQSTVQVACFPPVPDPRIGDRTGRVISVICPSTPDAVPGQGSTEPDVILVGGIDEAPLPGVWLGVGSLEATVTLTATAQHRPGLSRLDPGDATPFGGAYGLADGEVVTVGGRAGRALDVDGNVAVVVPRADDVLLRITSTGLTLAEVLAFVEGLVPVLT